MIIHYQEHHIITVISFHLHMLLLKESGEITLVKEMNYLSPFLRNLRLTEVYAVCLLIKIKAT